MDELLRLEPGDLDYLQFSARQQHPASPCAPALDSLELPEGALPPVDTGLLWPPGLFDHDLDMYVAVHACCG